MPSFGDQLTQQAKALRGVFESPPLRRLQLAWGGYYAGEWAQVVALSVYAYHSGGTTAVGVLGLIRMAPAAAALPVGALLADRYRRERVLLVIHLARAATIGAAAVAVAAGGSRTLIFVLAALPPFSASPFRPAHWALLPVLARTPEELVAANVSGSTLEGAATLIGPMAAGLILAFHGPSAVLAGSAAVYLWCAFLVSRIEHPSDTGTASARKAGGVVQESMLGIRVVARDRSTRLLLSLFAAQGLVRGSLNVLIVVSSFTLLRLGESGVGFLNSSFGAGGLVGALAAVLLVGRRRLAVFFALGLLFWGAPIAFVGAWPVSILALVCLALVGAGNSVLDVAGLTLIQRAVDDTVLARAFGALEMLMLASVGLGSILAPLLIVGLGLRGTLVATGIFLPLLVLIYRARLNAIDDATVVPQRELDLLTNVPLFAPLPVTTLEKLASRLRAKPVAAGTNVINQGEQGDDFFLIDEGTADVTQDGRHIETLGAGEYFGEIALLRAVPRTATVTARTELLVYVLERETFLNAVTGHTQAAAAARVVTEERLARSSPD